MNLTTWRTPSRFIAPQEVEAFYGRPLRVSRAFLFETSRLELPPHGGSFSLKIVLRGEEEYFIGRRTVRVRPGDLLLVNAGEHYASRIREPCRSLSLFFSEQELAVAQSELSPDGDAILDVPQIRFSASNANWQRVIALVRLLQRRRLGSAGDAARSLLVAALGQLQGAAPNVGLMNVHKRSTRDELVSRLVRVREYIEDMRGDSCSVDRLAEVACLSRFHFMRVFKQVFGSSPVAYARSLRMPQDGRDRSVEN